MYNPTSNPYVFRYLKTGIKGPGIPCVYLPEIPPDEEILFRKEQKFVRPEPSARLQEWLDEYEEESELNPKYIHPHQKEIKEWEDQEWERSTNGIWFWNNKVITYITGYHYKYLTAWHMNFGMADYRETDKETWYWIKYWEEDPNCFGGTLNTIRREGKSSKMGFWITNRTITNYKHFSGMQAEENKKIEAFYQSMVINPFYKLPYYYQPTYDTNSLQKKGIIFQNPPRRNKKRIIKKDVLESEMDFRTSEENKYDQAMLHSYVMEEAGKCSPADTEVRMLDGSLKKVQDVVIGDVLIGDDSSPRVVLNTGKGFGKIYKINPHSKAEPWYVNEDHILSCKISDPGTIGMFKGMKKGDVFNISIKDYLASNKSVKKHLMCYRVGLEYPHRFHHINPYFLGAWLGDGTSSGVEITNDDEEVVSWFRNYCKENNLNFHKKKQINRSDGYIIGNGNNGIRNVFRQKNLLNNKHIPKDYLIDSRANRLKLLAGLIDTDGYKNPDRRCYEIVQKRKELAYQIQELCLSLGFNASLNSKIATMKRGNGTVYSCEVYRVAIFGHLLHEVPCLVKRKIISPDRIEHNAKDPSVYGFDVEYDRDDWYYGFNITGNRLYVLKDYTVTHNTLTANVDDRWAFVKPCLMDGIIIRGKAFIGTTVEFMDASGKGGKAYKKLCLESDYDDRDETGQTKSGLYAALMPGDCAVKGYFDEWGHPNVESATKWILQGRKRAENNPKDYAALVRKFPMNWFEVFYTNPDKCEFNAKILQDRIAELQINPVPIRKFNLAWENNVRFSRVVMTDDPVSGWFKMTSLPEKEKWNDVGKKYVNGLQKYFPKNNGIFRSGVDPIDHGVVVETVMQGDEFIASRRSRPVMLVKRLYDSNIDGPLNQEILEQRAKEKYDYKTGKYFAMMDSRPNDPNVWFERCLMVCWLLSMKIHVESQKPGVINWFRNAGCDEFLWQKYVPDEKKIKASDYTEGTPASPVIIQEYTGAIATDVEYFGHTYPFIEYPEDLLVFNPAKTRIHDYAVAGGNTELSCKMTDKQVQLPMVDIGDYLPLYNKWTGEIMN
jgi:hypothetical protein